MKRSVVGLVMLLALPSVAFAERGEYSRGGWSVISGKTVGSGQNVLDIDFGYPGISVGFLHGVSDRFDIGGRFAFNYGLEGTFNVLPGLKPQFLLKIGLLNTGKVNLALNLEPGVLLYFSGVPVFGITVPAGLTLGLPVSDVVNLGFTFDLPFWIAFDQGAIVEVPILFGGSVEYFIDRNLALTFKLKLGPTVGTLGANFTLVSQIGIAIKL